MVAGKPVSFKTEEINLFYFLRSELAGPPEADHYRYFEDSCDMILYAAGEEYYKYLKLNQVSGGLTANEIRPVYTSIKGPDAMGLFSTRGNRQRSKIPINYISAAVCCLFVFYSPAGRASWAPVTDEGWPS